MVVVVVVQVTGCSLWHCPAEVVVCVIGGTEMFMCGWNWVDDFTVASEEVEISSVWF